MSLGFFQKLSTNNATVADRPSSFFHTRLNPIAHAGGKIPIEPSAFAQQVLKMPTQVSKMDYEGNEYIATEYQNFSLEGRPYIYRLYDTTSRRILLMCGRQVEKSTFLGNKELMLAMLVAGIRLLHVTPTQIQAERFSMDRLDRPAEDSELVKALLSGGASKSNVLYKRFRNGSDITMRYAFLTADRIRGVSVNGLFLDELQDILIDLIPVLEQALSHSPKVTKTFVYAGTPKGFDNTLATYYYENSTMNEWAIPCDGCGSKRAGGRYWNVCDQKNIGKTALVCSKCSRKISPQHADALWVNTSPREYTDGMFDGYRIPQLITPWVDWAEIVRSYRVYPTAQFHNEVLGLPFATGSKPLSTEDIRANCLDNYSMNHAIGRGWPATYAGIDWGTGDAAFSVITICAYVGDKFQVIFAKRFEGDDARPDTCVQLCRQIINQFKCTRVGADYGFGYDRNNTLLSHFGAVRYLVYQYGDTNAKISYNHKLNRYLVNKTAVGVDIINAIKDGRHFRFPRFAEWETPFGRDMTNLVMEKKTSTDELMLTRAPKTTDDSFHSFVYAFLASLASVPRNDIIAPGADMADTVMR